MTHLTIKIDEVTPEIQKTLDYLTSLSGVTISHGKSTKPATKSAWNTAIAEGAVTVDAFFNELDARIEKWPETRA